MAARRAAPCPALQLHARAVAVPLYPRRPPIEVSAQPPPHMAARLDMFAPSLRPQ
jgi:tRNA pseudouridine32 synthase/23S rRNA pseudouridine746 synthase